MLIGRAALPATGLIQPGSLVHHALRAVLPAKALVPGVLRAVLGRFGGEGWQIRSARNALPGITRFIDQVGLFMSLVGLVSLLVGGIGVANGVRAWLEGRARSIATLRCLGASGRMVFAVCLIEVLLLCAAGIVIGLVVGALAPLAGLALLRGVLPVPPQLGLYPGALAVAGAYGLLTALCFALWPVGRAVRIPGGALFREGALEAGGRPGAGLVAANGGVAAGLVGLAIASSADPGFAAWFCGAAVLSLLLLRLGALGLTRVAGLGGRLGGGPAALGVGNLHRSGARAALMFVSVSGGLAVLAAIALIEGNMQRVLARDLPANAPSFYFIDIQDDQLARFLHVLAAQPGVETVRQVPSLRARIVAVDGVPADRVKTTPQTAWALRGDRGLTYAATPPAGTRLVAGRWWKPDYRGTPLVSFDAGLARGWNLHVGGTITVNVLGRDIDLRVASLRDIAWRTLGLNFAMVASPGLLEHAPHSHIAAVRVRPAAEGAVLRAVTDALPNVTGISVRDVLGTVGALVRRISAALAATGLVALAAGALVLSSALAAGQRRRVRDAVVLKTLGATRGQLRIAWLAEFGVLGAAAGLAAGGIGVAASYAVLRFALHSEWVFLPWRLLVFLAGCVALMLLLSYGSLEAALRAKAAPVLRDG